MTNNNEKSDDKLCPTNILNLEDKLTNEEFKKWYAVFLVTFIDERGNEVFKNFALKKE
jgi:hypothetical protein